MLGTIQAEERVLRRNTSTLRPLARFIGVRAGGSTKNLQRAVVDFGAEDSFAQASERLLRHHGVLLCASSVRKITLEHARRIEASQRASGGQGALPRTGAETIIAEMDGTMLPIVETSKTKDRNGPKEPPLPLERDSAERRTGARAIQRPLCGQCRCRKASNRPDSIGPRQWLKLDGD